MSGRRSRRAVPRADRLARRRTRARVCVSCRRVRPKREMIRVVRRPDGTAEIDHGATKPGRGAYVCPEPACAALARRRLAGSLQARRADLDTIVAGLEAVTS